LGLLALLGLLPLGLRLLALRLGFRAL